MKNAVLKHPYVPSKDELAAARAKALEQIKRACQVEELATVKARMGNSKWPVTIKRRAGEYFDISGRGTSLTVYITETYSGYLVSVPNHKRCGNVPADCNMYDVMNYVGIENEVDASTLAAGVRWLIEHEQWR